MFGSAHCLQPVRCSTLQTARNRTCSARSSEEKTNDEKYVVSCATPGVKLHVTIEQIPLATITGWQLARHKKMKSQGHSMFCKMGGWNNRASHLRHIQILLSFPVGKSVIVNTAIIVKIYRCTKILLTFEVLAHILYTTLWSNCTHTCLIFVLQTLCKGA